MKRANISKCISGSIIFTGNYAASCHTPQRLNIFLRKWQVQLVQWFNIGYLLLSETWFRKFSQYDKPRSRDTIESKLISVYYFYKKEDKVWSTYWIMLWLRTMDRSHYLPVKYAKYIYTPQNQNWNVYRKRLRTLNLKIAFSCTHIEIYRNISNMAFWVNCMYYLMLAISNTEANEREAELWNTGNRLHGFVYWTSDSQRLSIEDIRILRTYYERS